MYIHVRDCERVGGFDSFSLIEGKMGPRPEKHMAWNIGVNEGHEASLQASSMRCARDMELRSVLMNGSPAG